jgi:hypothetical protein
MILNTKAGNYYWHDNWAKVPDASSNEYRAQTHAVVVAKSGHIYVFHQAIPAVLVYSPAGQLLRRWGNYPGAHGMTLVAEGDQEFLWLVDQDAAIVEKTTLTGEVVQRISKPDYPEYRDGTYIPTWTAVNEIRHGGNGDIWIADGYGCHLVHRYDATGRYLMTIDGTVGAGHFDCPHGIWFDARKKSPELYVADRRNHRIQVYDGEGHFKRTFGTQFLTSPCGFTHFKDRLIIPDLRGGVTILDSTDALIDYIGRNEAVCSMTGWPDETPVETGKLNSPHGADVDAWGNIFVVEWRRGGRIIKLEKILPSQS